MKVLAFLQNAWFPLGTKQKYIDMYLDSDDFRRRVLARGWSGKRLLNAFGSDLFSKIVWDNVSTEIGQESGHQGVPDYEHITSTINKHKPLLILTFGRLAKESVGYASAGIKILSTKHPSARGFKNEHLKVFVSLVKQHLKEEMIYD